MGGSIHFDLGIKKLIPVWKQFFSSRYLLSDLYAGITVAFVAIPLSLAIALASGVPPAVGLITAIIAGIICAFFGGTTLSICGPAAAMSVLLGEIVQKYGFSSLIWIGLMAGCMQLISGIVGLGRLGKYVPLPVIAGFTAGIGVIIMMGQLPRAFGLAPTNHSNIVSVLEQIPTYLTEANITCVLLVILTIAIIRGLPKLFSKAPAILIAVIIGSVINYFLHLKNVPLIGAIPNALPTPHIPTFSAVHFQTLLVNAFFVYLLASLETLLSCSAIDKMAKGKKHDSNQELIGQGLSNITVPFFGGIPVTSVIARSATNVRAGGKTRRASIIHSLIIVLAVYVASPLISHIPIAALSGVLFSVAFTMINVREFRDLWKNARAEAYVYAITFSTIIYFDLLAGIQAGLIASCLIILITAAKTHLFVTRDNKDNVIRLTLEGALTFLSSAKISDLQNTLSSHYQDRIIIIDLSNIQNLDSSGATAIVEFYQHCQSLNIPFYLMGLAKRFESLFEISGGKHLLDEHYLVSEHQLRTKSSKNSLQSYYGRLSHGVQRYYARRQQDHNRLLDFISDKQDPHTLFITCSDSRIMPSSMTSTDPGELFTIRNIGNQIPLYSTRSNSSEVAALELALHNFDIRDIVICGHANCAAIQACISPEIPNADSLKNWIDVIKSELNLGSDISVNELSCQNVLNQLQHLESYPIIQEKLKSKKINLHAWFFDVEQGIVFEWNKKDAQFKSMHQLKEHEYAFKSAILQI